MEELDFSDKPTPISLAGATLATRADREEENRPSRRIRPVRFHLIEDRLEELRLEKELKEVYDC